ncbi:MAG TPA: hypothetical protein VHQ65_03140 [Thermoanaerobaculia bacterium]|nr:hypothetical protein [Thermoanaerobaculia bacterium]
MQHETAQAHSDHGFEQQHRGRGVAEPGRRLEHQLAQGAVGRVAGAAVARIEGDDRGGAGHLGGEARQQCLLATRCGGPAGAHVGGKALHEVGQLPLHAGGAEGGGGTLHLPAPQRPRVAAAAAGEEARLRRAEGGDEQAAVDPGAGAQRAEHRCHQALVVRMGTDPQQPGRIAGKSGAGRGGRWEGIGRLVDRLLAGRVVVEALPAGDGVGGGEHPLDGGQRRVEQPQVPVDRPSVEHLDHRLRGRRSSRSGVRWRFFCAMDRDPCKNNRPLEETFRRKRLPAPLALAGRSRGRGRQGTALSSA